MDKHAEAVFKAADYYEVTALKLLCEKALMKKVTGRRRSGRMSWSR